MTELKEGSERCARRRARQGPVAMLGSSRESAHRTQAMHEGLPWFGCPDLTPTKARRHDQPGRSTRAAALHSDAPYMLRHASFENGVRSASGPLHYAHILLADTACVSGVMPRTNLRHTQRQLWRSGTGPAEASSRTRCGRRRLCSAASWQPRALRQRPCAMS